MCVTAKDQARIELEGMLNRRADAADVPASADISAAWTLDRVGTGKVQGKNARFLNMLYETQAGA